MTRAGRPNKAQPTAINANEQLRESFSPLERMALTVTKRVGTFGFFLAILAWSVLWLGWNTVGPKSSRFDPAPAFVLWLFVSNLIQICLMPLLLVGQNLQGRHSEIRAENDFAVNKRAEAEVATILERLRRQQELLEELQGAIEALAKRTR